MSDMRRPTPRLAAALLLGAALSACGAQTARTGAGKPATAPAAQPEAKDGAQSPAVQPAGAVAAAPVAPRVASGPDFDRAQNECINRAIIASEKKRTSTVASPAALGDYTKCMEEKGYRQSP